MLKKVLTAIPAVILVGLNWIFIRYCYDVGYNLYPEQSESIRGVSSARLTNVFIIHRLPFIFRPDQATKKRSARFIQIYFGRVSMKWCGHSESNRGHQLGRLGFYP